MVETSRVARWRQRNRDAGKEALTIWLSREDKARLLDLAQQWHTSPSALVTEALVGYQPTRPAVSTDADTSQLRLLIREVLREELPGMLQDIMVGLSIVTERVADTVTEAITASVTETATDTLVTDTVTDTVAGSVAETVAETVAEMPAAEDLGMLTGAEHCQLPAYDTEKHTLGKLCQRVVYLYPAANSAA